MSVENLTIDNQDYQTKVTRTVDKDGSLYYKCELLGSTISTFLYSKNYDGKTLEEAIQKIAHELRRALDELSEY